MDVKDIKHDIEMCELFMVCHFCRSHLFYYTTKRDWTYLSNNDRSPHRKSYMCVYNWVQYNELPKIEHIEPRRKENMPDYIVAPYVEL